MLKLEHVKKTFNKGSANEVILYRDLNVEIHDGEFVTIIGSNGTQEESLSTEKMSPVFPSINAPSLSAVYFRTRKREPPHR